MPDGERERERGRQGRGRRRGTQSVRRSSRRHITTYGELDGISDNAGKARRRRRDRQRGMQGRKDVGVGRQFPFHYSRCVSPNSLSSGTTASLSDDSDVLYGHFGPLVVREGRRRSKWHGMAMSPPPCKFHVDDRTREICS